MKSLKQILIDRCDMTSEEAEKYIEGMGGHIEEVNKRINDDND